MGKIVNKAWTTGTGTGIWGQSSDLKVIPDTAQSKWRIVLTLSNGTKRGFTGLSYTRGSHELKSTCSKANKTYYIWIRAYDNFATLKGTCYKSNYVDPTAIDDGTCPVFSDPLEGTFTSTHPR